MPTTSQQELVRKITTIAISASTGDAPEDAPPEIDPTLEAISVEYIGSRAVEEAVDAYNAAYRHALRNKENEAGARKAGSKAYRQKIPALHNSCNIADFIACVGHGLVLGIFEGSEARSLLYAAQVAHTAIPDSVRRWPVRRGRPSSTTIEPPERYVGPEDDFAGIIDPKERESLRKYYAGPTGPRPRN